MTNQAVVVVGGGPTGLMLGAELALGGVEVAIVERRPTRELAGSRAGGLHARSLEVLDQRGIADRFLAEGKPAQVAGFAGIQLDIGDFPTRHPYGLGLWQNHIERILADRVDELGVPVLRGCEASGLAQDEAGVNLTLADGRTLRADYVVGCDGGRSMVRKAAGIDFPGSDPTVSHLIAEVELAEEPAEWGLRRDGLGLHGLSRMDDSPRVRVMVTEASLGGSGEPDLATLRAAMRAVWGSDHGAHNPHWISRFTDMARQAAAYRAGRVLLAGDAAHVHYPAGGQGLNTGMQDAVNLGWKVALVAKGAAPDSLLDSYHRERHPVGAEVLRNTLAAVALMRRDDRSQALHGIVADLLRFDAPRKDLAGAISGLAIRYDLGEGHPLLGRRMPDLDLVTAEGPVRVYELLHEARGLLLNFGGKALDVAGWDGRVRRVGATCAGSWALPVVGAVAAPEAVLVRPDGHVAWVGDGTADGLETALTAWFGAATPAPSRRRPPPPARPRPPRAAPGRGR